MEKKNPQISAIKICSILLNLSYHEEDHGNFKIIAHRKGKKVRICKIISPREKIKSCKIIF
jgi:hypothetical protein